MAQFTLTKRVVVNEDLSAVRLANLMVQKRGAILKDDTRTVDEGLGFMFDETIPIALMQALTSLGTQGADNADEMLRQMAWVCEYLQHGDYELRVKQYA